MSVKVSFVFQQLMKLGLSEDNAITLCQHIKIVSYDANRIILRRGEDVKNWHFIITGLVVASLDTHKLASTGVMLLSQRTWFGEHSIINRKPNPWDYTALESTDCLIMPSQYLLEYAQKDQRFLMSLLKIISWRMQYASEMLTIMKLGSPPLRVVMCLAQFVEALSNHSERPPTIGFGEGLRLPVNQTILANLCGVSRSVFSEIIKGMERNGLISVSYGEVEVLNISSWGKFAAKRRASRFEDLSPDLNTLMKEFDMIPPI